MDETGHMPTETDGVARPTSDESMAALFDLKDTETKMRAIPTDSAEFVRLAVVADEAGTMVARWTAAQPGSSGGQIAAADVRRFRDEYQDTSRRKSTGEP